MHPGGKFDFGMALPVETRPALCYTKSQGPAVLAGNKNVFEEKQTMKLTMLGTGNALVTECYNTCFVLSDGNDHFMVDGGGGMTGKMTPCAVLVIQNGTTKLVNVKNQDGLTKILDMVPDFVDRFASGKGEEA